MSRPRQVSDDQILSAARECFLEHGAHAPTSLIAEKLGVSQAALFKRFGSKENLLVAALRPPAVPPWVALLDEGPDNRPLEEQLVEIGVAMARFFDNVVPCLMALKASDACLEDIMGDDDVPPPVRGSRAVAAWVKRAQKQKRLADVDPWVLTHALLGALTHRGFLKSIAGPEAVSGDIETYVASLVGLLLRGLDPDKEVRR